MKRGKRKPKKRFSVVYRRSTHDKRQYGTNPYIPHFLDIFASRCKPDNETLGRIIPKKGGMYYRYYPSPEYRAFKREQNLKMARGFTNEGILQVPDSFFTHKIN